MNRAWFRFLVPREWNGEQALAVVGVLQAAVDAIWSVHGEEMAAELGERRCRATTGDDEDEDDIPF